MMVPLSARDGEGQGRAAYKELIGYSVRQETIWISTEEPSGYEEMLWKFIPAQRERALR